MEENSRIQAIAGQKKYPIHRHLYALQIGETNLKHPITWLTT